MGCLAEREARPPLDCQCGHKAEWHLHGPENWGECDAMDCDCPMYAEFWDG